MTWSGRFNDFNDLSADNNETSSGPIQPSGSTASATLMKIQNLNAQTQSASIIGIVLAKDGPKSISNKQGTERFLLALTIRDSPDHMINLTCWGKEEFINAIAEATFIGDVVQVINAQVQPKSSQQNEAKYKPWTPSNFQLNLSENSGSVVPYGDQDAALYSQLLHVPVKATNDFYTLDDIHTNGTTLEGEHINLLVAVKKVGPLKSFKTRTGKSTKKCEVIVFDETCESFTLDLWGENGSIPKTWIPFSTVLFATDVKISHNEYKATMVATADSKTIFITNPGTPEAQHLSEYAFSIGDMDDAAAFESEYINDPQNVDFANMKISTVEEINQMKHEMKSSSDSNARFAKCVAVLTSFDITPDDGNTFSTVCSKCHHEVKDEEEFRCRNPTCSMATSLEAPEVYLEYRIFLSLSDYTGSLTHCYLARPVSEKLLGYKAGDFINLDEETRTQLKWNHLLEKRILHIKLQKLPSDSTGRPHVTVVSVCPLENGPM